MDPGKSTNEAIAVPLSQSTGSRRRAAIAIGIAVSIVFVALAVRNIHVAQVAEELAGAALTFLVVSVFTKLAGMLALTVRSQVLLEPLHAFSPSLVFKSLLVGFGGNNVLPLRMGELLRIDYLARHGGVPRASCLSVVVLERLLDALCIFTFFAAGIPLMLSDLDLGGALYPLGFSLLVAVFVALVASRYPGALVVLCRRVASLFGVRAAEFAGEKAGQLAGGLAALSSMRSVVFVVLLSALSWMLTMVSIQLWIWAFHLSLPWYAALLVLGFIAFGTALPSAPGYVGTYHYFAAAAMELLGVDPDVAVSFAIVGHAVSVVPVTLIASSVVYTEVRDFRRGGS